MNPKHNNWITSAINESIAALQLLLSRTDTIEAALALLIETLAGGHKVLTAGNGGSAAEAMHMAEELVGRYRGNRRSLPGIALTADGTALTCIGNDFGFDHIFSRQIEGLAAPGDLLVLFSTSGKATNLALAVTMAREKGMRLLTILGRDGGPLAGLADCEIIVPATATERIQEAHQLLLHLLLEGVERWCPPDGERS